MTGNFDDVTVTVQGNRLQLSVPPGHGISILSDEQAHAAMGSKSINSASKWFNTAARGNVLPEQTTFLTGEVTLPRDVNVLYLHSDTRAGFRDTEGPVPQQRATIAKIAIGVTPGPQVGEVLREVETWWVDSDFPEDVAVIARQMKDIALNKPRGG